MEAILLFGLVQEGKILSKMEKNFFEEDKKNIKNVISDTITKYIQAVLDTAKVKLNKIEVIRNCSASELLKMVL